MYPNQESGSSHINNMYQFSKKRRLDRRCCHFCCVDYNTAQNRDFYVRDFPYLYDKVMSLQLEDNQKYNILSRFTNIMDRVKQKYRLFFFFHVCTKSFLIVGNILIPSVLSIEAMFYENEDVRMVVFWSAFILSVIIAVTSSFVNFFNTQQKYNLYNQFNTIIQREIHSYIHLTGPYKILAEHLDLLKTTKDNVGYRPTFVNIDGNDFELSDNEESEDSISVSKMMSTNTPSKINVPPEETKQNIKINTTVSEDEATEEDSKLKQKSGFKILPPEDLFVDNNVTKYSVDDVPYIIRNGHMFHYFLFMERLESLYRRLTNNNIEMNHDELDGLQSNKNTLSDKKKQQQQMVQQLQQQY